MPKNKVSIIIPAFNPGKILRNAIESVITQDYPVWELIIIDGGSTDGTEYLIEQYSNHIAYWCSEPDRGIYDAMNKGLAKATGVWALFLGADDELLHGVLGTVFNNFDFLDSAIIYGKVSIKNTNKELGSETNFDQLIEKNIPHQAIFYNKTMLDKFGGYVLRYKILSDYDLNLKIFEDASLKKTFINIIISGFENEGISNRTIDSCFFRDKRDYFIQNLKMSEKDKKIAKYFFYSGVVSCLEKEYRKGVCQISHSIIYSKIPFHFFLLTVDFILSLIGLRKRYKYF